MISRIPRLLRLPLAFAITVLIAPSPAWTQEPLVGIQFTNPGFATMNVYRVRPSGADEHWGAVARMSTSIRIPSHPGEVWRFRLAASANADVQLVRFEYRATNEPQQQVQLPGFLENEKDPGPDYAMQAVLQLKKVTETVLNTLSFTSPPLICPGGERLPRPRAWDASVWRALPMNSMESDLRANCPAPTGLPQTEWDWWYTHSTKEVNACSGPIGDAMSRWGSNYEWLQDACIVHDLCYTDVMPKATCDSNFVQNMGALCNAPGFSDWATYPACAVTRDVISDIFWVPGFQSSYDGDQEQLRRRMAG